MIKVLVLDLVIYLEFGNKNESNEKNKTWRINMAETKMKLQNKAVKPFLEKKPDFDILHFDFNDKNAVDRLELEKTNI
jgi:flagellar basal body rod protein FlgB